VIEDPGDAVDDRGGGFAQARMWQIGEEGGGDLAAAFSEGVAVEEEKRRAAVTVAEEAYGVLEGEDSTSFLLPLSRCRRLSLAIKAVLRATSFARSSVEADDKLPTPVFEKRGSGL
jgi:hypothetical protein